MTALHDCSTCAFWRAGTPGNMSQSALDQASAELGTCQNFIPQIFVINGVPEAHQPVTHSTRCCGEWMAAWPDDNDPDGDCEGGPVPKPEPDLGRVRHLFPIRPVPADQ